MKRILCLCMALVCVFVLFAGCSEKYEEAVFDEAFMLEKGRQLADDLCALAGNEAIEELLGMPEETIAYVRDIGRCNAGNADEAYLISGTPSLKRVLQTWGGAGDLDDFSAAEQELLAQRFRWSSALPSQVNGRFGTAMLAATAYITIDESYRVEEIGEESYLLVLYRRGNFAVAVSFAAGGEGIVQARATAVPYDALEALEAAADDLRLDFEELDLSELES